MRPDTDHGQAQENDEEGDHAARQDGQRPAGESTKEQLANLTHKWRGGQDRDGRDQRQGQGPAGERGDRLVHVFWRLPARNGHAHGLNVAIQWRRASSRIRPGGWGGHDQRTGYATAMAEQSDKRSSNLRATEAMLERSILERRKPLAELALSTLLEMEPDHPRRRDYETWVREIDREAQTQARFEEVD